jgi:hypothetical protein
MFLAVIAYFHKDHARPTTAACLLAWFLFVLPVSIMGGVFVVTPVAHAAWDPATAGARTPFNRSNSLDLQNYCNGSDNGDDTICIGRWLKDARTQGKHLYVSPGTYLYGQGQAIFNGFHLQCASPTRTVFKAINNAGNLFVLLPNWLSESDAPWQDISIENCGFNLNGSTVPFASVIAVGGGTWPVQYVTVRGNKVFDSTMAGRLYTKRDPKRQYIAILNTEDVLVEHNALSEGGRIKVGRPGRRIIIRANTLNGVSENGITVVDQGGISSDMLIEHNTITNPINSGIFFGADGQNAGTAAMQLYDVTIRHNTITGNFVTNCITGVLPNNVARIYIGDNTCHKTGPTPPGVFVGGIGLNRDNTATLYAKDITVEDNIILSDVYNAYSNLAGIYVADHFDNLCLLGNSIYDTSTAIYLRSNMPHVKATGNTLDGGVLRIGQRGAVESNVQVDQSGNTVGCFVASPLLD